MWLGHCIADNLLSANSSHSPLRPLCHGNLAVEILKVDIFWSGAATDQPPGMTFVEYLAIRQRPPDDI